MKTHSCAEKPDSEIFRSLHGRFCSLTFKTTCQRIESFSFRERESSARLQLACGMAVSFNHSRLSAFTRVHSARELHVTASTQSKCLSVSSRPQQGAQHPFTGRLSTIINLPAAWRQVSTNENHQASTRLAFGMSRQRVICVLLGSLCPAGKWNRS